MNVYFVLFVLLSGTVPTEVVPARDNLLPGHFKPRQSAPPVRANEVYQMKDTTIRKWANEHTSQTNILKRHRRKRAYTPPKAKSTAGLEKDTDDPDGVYRTLDALKLMKPGPGVQWRDEMPVMSKDNTGDLRRKKRSNKLTTREIITTKKRANESYPIHPQKLFPLNDIREQTEGKLESTKLHVNSNMIYDGVAKSSNVTRGGINGRLQHSANLKTLYKRKFFHRLENDANKFTTGENTASSRRSEDIQAVPGTDGFDTNVLTHMLSHGTVKGNRNSRHRSERETESNDRMYDSTEEPPSGDADMWWNKKLDYIDSRKPYMSKQTNNTSSDNSDNTSEKRHASVSVRGVISEERYQQSGSKQSQQNENSGDFGSDKKHTGQGNTEGKGDDWLKNELMLIEIESRALKRKAAQLHNKLRNANLNLRQGGSESGPMYPAERSRQGGSDSGQMMYPAEGSRQDVIETYARLNKRIDNEGMPRMRGFQNIQATEHRIERKRRLPVYGGRLHGDIADAVIRLDNDLSDLKAKVMRRNEREHVRPGDYYRRSGSYRNMLSDTGNRGDYYSDHGRYRRHVADNYLKQRGTFLRLFRNPSSQHQTMSSHGQTFNCTHGSLCSKQTHIYLAATVLREQKHRIGTKNIFRNIFNEIFKGHTGRTSYKFPFHLHWNTSLNWPHVTKLGKGIYPATIECSIPRMIISLTKLLHDISTLPEVDLRKCPLLTAHGISWHVGYKFPCTLEKSETLNADMNWSNVNFTKTHVFVLVLNVASMSRNTLLIVPHTSRGGFTLLRAWAESRKLTTQRVRKHKQTRSSNKDSPPDDTAKRRKFDGQLNIFPCSPKLQKLSTQILFILDPTHRTLKTSAKCDQKNMVSLYLYLTRYVRPLREKPIRFSNLQSLPRRMHLSYGRSIVHPSVIIICDRPASGLLSKHTRTSHVVLYHGSYPLQLEVFPVRTRKAEYVRAKPTSNSGNILLFMRTIAKRNRGDSQANAGLALTLQAKHNVLRRTKHISRQLDKIYISWQPSQSFRLFVQHFKNNKLKLQKGSRFSFASPLQILDTRPTENMVSKKVRNKRSNDLVIADPETANEISLKEDLDNLFKKFPVSYSEKLMNAKLEQAEEAEMASADVGKFIMKRTKDTESIQDVPSSETRLRRQALASGDFTQRKTSLENIRRWFLRAALRDSTREVSNPGTQQQPHESRQVRLRSPLVRLFGNKAHTINSQRLDRDKYSNSLQTIDNTVESMEGATNTSNVPRNRTSYTLRTLMNLVGKGGNGLAVAEKASTLPIGSHKLTTGENYSTTFVQTTLLEMNHSPRNMSTSDMVVSPTSHMTDISNSDKTDILTFDVTETPSSDMTDTPTSAIMDMSATDVAVTLATDMTDTPTSAIMDMSAPGVAVTLATDMTDTPTSAIMDMSAPDVTVTPATDMTDTPTSAIMEMSAPDVAVTLATDMTDTPTSANMGMSTLDVAVTLATDMMDTPISEMTQSVFPLPVNLRLINNVKKNERSLENAAPVTGLGVELHHVERTASGDSLTKWHNFSSHSEVAEMNETEQIQVQTSLVLNSSFGNETDVDNTTNETSLPSVYNTSSHREVNETKQIQTTNSFMLNSSYDDLTNVPDLGNVTNNNTAIKSLMATFAHAKNPEFNKALKSLMTNSSSRARVVASNQTANGSRKPGQGQKPITDYFDNNANVEAASEVAEDQDVALKSADLQDIDDKVPTEKPETAEGIQVDVKGHKVEPVEPFAFIEKDETKPPAESQYTWGEWSECSATCGVGQKFRTNRCGGDQPCSGIRASFETEVCSIKDEC